MEVKRIQFGLVSGLALGLVSVRFRTGVSVRVWSGVRKSYGAIWFRTHNWMGVSYKSGDQDYINWMGTN